MIIIRFLCSIAADKFGLMANISPKIKRVLVFFCAFSWIILHPNKIECLREMFSILYYTVFFLLELLAKLSSHCYKKKER